MGKVILDISMSLDGFISGPNDSYEQPLGERGERLHEWISKGTSGDLMQGGTAATTGAIVVGRRTYDLVDGWGGNHPLHGVPVFVVSHDIPEVIPKGATPFTFIADGVKKAIKQARAAAGVKNVYVVGGANVAQQCINAELLDEIRLHLVHVLLGGGVRLFDNMNGQTKLEKTSVIDSSGVTHFAFSQVN